MVTNPYEEASSSRARGGGRIWLVALAPLVATVAWAAPLGGQGPTAELSYGTHHLVLSDGKVTLTETVTFEEAQPARGTCSRLRCMPWTMTGATGARSR